MKLSRIWMLFLAIAVIGSISSRVMAEETADLYKAKCQSCHGADGKGDTAVGKKLEVRDFHSPVVVKESDADLFDITKNGKNKMPKYDGKLNDDQIKDLIKYIRSLK